ncbi:MAG: endonuclease MutS2 [Anaerolineae bacterium]
MHEKYLITLELNKILDQLAQHTSFSASREMALALRPSMDEVEVREWLQQTTEAKALLATQADVSVGGARDVRGLARRASLEGILQPTELLEIRITLASARSLRLLFTKRAAEFPLLANRAASIEPLSDIIDEIGRCLDDDGRVLDSASPTLTRLRRESAIARDRLVERLRRLVISGDKARYLQEPIVTERNGRYVIPVKAEHKGHIPGIIHDQSSSGATFFVEPLETVELNNNWHQLQLAEQREVERILTELTRTVGGEADAITMNVEILADLDLAFAKGRYSYALRAAPAMLSSARWPTVDAATNVRPGDHPVNLIRARHPLLPAESVVPVNIYLGANYTVLLVTGPNTGGKTVSLKTMGLLAAMNQCGLHIPAMDGSQLPVFSGIYADIGDEQSIEQSLSTFSSHMSRIVEILSAADAFSLVLLDELGAGTDPVEGSALAQALTNELIEKGCLTMCSTHYSQLKVFAFSTPRVQNASVEFDVDTLSPTYRLTIGLPGRSNAFAIAGRLGLSPHVIDRARQLVSAEDLTADAMLAEVKAASDAAIEAHQEAETRRLHAAELERALSAKLSSIEQTRRDVLEEAREQGRRELERVRGELRQLRATWTERGPEPTEIQRVLADLQEISDQLAPPPPVMPEPAAPSREKLQVGDKVFVASLGQTGDLLSINGDEAEVGLGGLRLRTRARGLEFRGRPKPAAPGEDRSVRAPLTASPGMELDLRGWRAEQVTPELDRYLDAAYLAGLPWVHIIHGKGMGVLKQIVRQFVSSHPLVATYRAGALAEGGEGVTVVELHQRSE